MYKPRILVVEDDAASAQPDHDHAGDAGLSVSYGAVPAASRIMEAVSNQPDVVILDLGLPDMDGVDIIKKIRGWSNMPIIVVSARSEDRDKIDALDAGADDFLTKPFSVEELVGETPRHTAPAPL